MPYYTFRCTDKTCSTEFLCEYTIYQYKMRKDGEPVCPRCGASSERQIKKPTTIIFRGGGWGGNYAS